jgi:hypothetical protein
MAAAVAPVKVSPGAVRFRIGLFHFATTRMTPKNDTTFATKAVATPVAAITAPATAGPTALARLNSIPFKADAAARSSFETNSDRMARQVGFSNASPAESANVSTSSNQGEVRPLMVRTARTNATPTIQASVYKTSLRRSKISPAEPAGSASRK